MLNLGGYLLVDNLASKGHYECNWYKLKRDYSRKEEVVQCNEMLHCVVIALIVNVSRGTFIQILGNQVLITYYIFDPGLGAGKAVTNQITLYLHQV